MATNRPQGDAPGRIQCPNCHANNFVGQPQCWQCQAPLAAGGPGRSQHAVHQPVPVQPFPIQPFPTAPAAPPPAAFGRATSARPHTLLLVGIAMLAFVSVLYVARSRSGSSLPASSGPAALETPRPVPDAGAPAGNADSQAASSSPSSVDPVEEAARRAVSREAPNLGLPPPPTISADGKVHLRTGGTISADDWNEARRKLQGNPLLKEPPLPPPF